MRQRDATPDGRQAVACALCDGTATRGRYRKFGQQIVQCVRCGLVYVSPRHAKEVVHLRYSPEYFHQEYLPAQGVVGGKVDMGQIVAHNAPMIALMEARAGVRGSVFEIGAGAGLFLAASVNAGWTARGVELSAEAVKFARETLGVDVSERAAEELPLDDVRFDAVVMFDVIEHLFDPIAVLRSARAMLRPNGVVIVSTPNFDALSRRVLGAEWAILSPLEHLYYFTEATLGRALAQSGFVGAESVRRHSGWNVFHTMNGRNTHKPGSWRSRAYQTAVRGWGGALYDWVQRTGRSDILLMIARAPDTPATGSGAESDPGERGTR